MDIILGSQSEGRAQVLREAGYDFTIMHANIDEKAIRHDDPAKLTQNVARAKAAALLPQIKQPALLITGDHVVIHQGTIREKPGSIDEARTFLTSYSGYLAENISSIVVTNTKTGMEVFGTDRATVYFKIIPDDVIEKILTERKVMYAAGGFIVQDPLLVPFINHIDGAIDTVIGLPLRLTKKLLAEVSV